MNDIILFEAISEYKRVNLENRLIDFALQVREILTLLPGDEFTRNLKGLLSRSSTSPAFNYGEAQSAESRKDFVYKMQICLKELRESHVGIKIIKRGSYEISIDKIDHVKSENNELIAIFVRSIHTAKKKLYIAD